MSLTNSKILSTYLTLTLFTNLNLSPAHGEKHFESSSKFLIGVPPDRRDLYKLDNSQTFKCIDGSGSISAEFVNDNYCDCRDASDEPGTSACPHGRFYCQNEGYISKLISSSWVNDNQCDCCDGSDEYNSTVFCENTCHSLGESYRQEQEKHREISSQGSARRSQYKEQAKLRREQSAQLLEQYRRELSEKENAIKKLEEEINSDFGPSNVFFPLKGKCFNFLDREYTYTLCPFERATQESTSGSQTELGRWSGWAGPQDDPYSRQKYEGGIQCWNGPARSALVNIACGVEDKIISVFEPSKCEYVYDFISPAACPDLDPPDVMEPGTDQQVVTEAPRESEAITETPFEDLDPDNLPSPPPHDFDDSTGEVSDRHEEL